MEESIEAPTPLPKIEINNDENISFSQNKDFIFLYQNKPFIITISLTTDKQY